MIMARWSAKKVINAVKEGSRSNGERNPPQQADHSSLGGVTTVKDYSWRRKLESFTGKWVRAAIHSRLLHSDSEDVEDKGITSEAGGP